MNLLKDTTCGTHAHTIGTNANRFRPKVAGLALAIALASASAVAEVYEAQPDLDPAAEALKPSASEPWRTAQAGAEKAERYTSSATRNAWVHGKLETTFLLNTQLNNFSIDSDVQNGTATLTGSVESEVDKDLAKQVALSVDGIQEVDNKLTVDRANARAARRNDDKDAEGRTFAQRISDATTTAAVKTSLLLNGNVEGLEVNVDTRNSVVTLSGEVDSAEEKMLAAQLARNSEDVGRVVNNLTIDRDGDSS